MTTLTISATAYSVQAVKPNTRYGQLAKLPMRSGSAGVMFRASLEKIPAGATITSAKVRWHVAQAATGTFTLQVAPFTTKWPSQLTWNKRPTQGTTYSAAPVTDPTAGQQIEVDITAEVQAKVFGTSPSFGWYAYSSPTTATLYMRGTTATSGNPVLVVTYTMVPPVPTGLQPSDGEITVDKPVLLFEADPFITGLQVQVDPAASETTPAFDSGQVAATGGLFDTAASSYVGLSSGSSYWRVRQQTAGGWSDWSDWAPFSRATDDTLTITSPAGPGPVAVTDGTMPITWTASSQVAYQARLLDITGEVIDDSGRISGDDTDWTPDAGLTGRGQHGLVEVTVWPAGNRAATPGAPVEITTTVEVILTPDATVEKFARVTAANLDVSPTVTVSGRRSEIPDDVVLQRNGKEISRKAGPDVCAPATGGGYVATMSDPRAVPNSSTAYNLVAVENNKQSAPGSTATIVPRCTGIWITREDDGTRVVLWTGDDQDQSQPEQSIVQRPVGDNRAVVRRRLMRGKPEGAIAGQIVTVDAYKAEHIEANLRAWVDPENSDAGDRYLLALGGYTGIVIIGDVTFIEIPNQYGERALNVTFNWWES